MAARWKDQCQVFYPQLNCTRRGRLRIDKLIDEYGRDMSLPDLRNILAGDCEHKTATRRKDQCQVFYPQLRELKREGAP